MHLENLLHRLEADRRELALRSGVNLTDPPVGGRVVDDDAIPAQHDGKIFFGVTGHDVSSPLRCIYRRAATFPARSTSAITESADPAPRQAAAFAARPTITGTEACFAPQMSDAATAMRRSTTLTISS